jgi:SAM-dependent methyltransferase
LTERGDWKSQPLGAIDSIIFDDLFAQHLEKTRDKSCLEIGCMPGGFLACICKTYGYSAHGIDFVPNSRRITEETLRANGITQSNILEEDVMDWKPSMQYDLVCSFGFVEHFTGDLFRDVFHKHVDVLKPGGRLIIEVPNFGHGQFVLHRLLDQENLSRHNIECMRVSSFRRMAEECRLNVLHLGYYGGLIGFWHENPCPNLLQRAGHKLVTRAARGLMRTPLAGWNNPVFSPFLIMVAERKRHAT